MRFAFCLVTLLVLLAPAMGRCQVAGCTVSATAVSFGSYSPLSSQPATSTGTVTVSCNSVSVTSYTIALSAGLGGSFSNRHLSSGSADLSYQLYLDSADTSIWGDGTDGTTVETASGLSCTQSCVDSFTIYGVIPASQTGASAGTYNDSVTVTVSY